jgi:hypothetical protein
MCRRAHMPWTSPPPSFRVSEGTATSSQPRGKHYVHVTVTDSAERDRRTPCDVPARVSGTLLTLFAVALISATAASAGTPIPLGPAPLAVQQVCSERARLHKFAVLCPTSYPHARDSSVTVSGLVLQGPSFYWASFNDSSGFPRPTAATSSSAANENHSRSLGYAAKRGRGQGSPILSSNSLFPAYSQHPCKAERHTSRSVPHESSCTRK